MGTESADPQAGQAQAQSQYSASTDTPSGSGRPFPGPMTVASMMVHAARPVARILLSPLRDVVWPMIVAETVRHTDLSAAIAKDVEAALAQVDLTAVVAERVDLDAVVKTALANADPRTLAEEIAAAQRDAAQWEVLPDDGREQFPKTADEAETTFGDLGDREQEKMPDDGTDRPTFADQDRPTF